MINLANKNKTPKEEYHCLDMKHLNIGQPKFDIAISIFSLNYLRTTKELSLVFKNVNKSLKKDGKFIFLVPHPLGSLINEKSKWYIHPKFEFNYSKDEGRFFKYKNKRINNKDFLEVGFYFHRLETYSRLLNKNGLIIKQILEPYPNDKISQKYDTRIEEEIPYYLIIEAIKC